MKKLVVFDLDGTLLDTSEGILFCYKKAAETVGLKEKTVNNRSIVIGGPLRDGFKTLYKVETENQIDNAITTYRKLYKDFGIKMFKPYENLENMLKALKEKDCILAVATLKLEEYAIQMLSSIHADVYFDVIKGWDGGAVCSKADILNSVLKETKVNPNQAVLVGDSEYDCKGAEAIGIDFIGVSYGFGYKHDNTCNCGFPVAETTLKIVDVVSEM